MMENGEPIELLDSRTVEYTCIFPLLGAALDSDVEVSN